MLLPSNGEISISVLQTTRQSESAKLGAVGQHSWRKLAYIPYSCPLPGQSKVVSNVTQKQPASGGRTEPCVLTERGLHRDGRRLLGLLAQAKDVDGLDPEHVALSWDQSVDHEPESTAVLPGLWLLVRSAEQGCSSGLYLFCLKGLWLQGNQSLAPTTRPSM